MMSPPGARSNGKRACRDEGSTLIMVLVLAIVGSMIVLPLMSYAISVLRANNVVGNRTTHSEAVKAGFRYAMAEPYDLFEKCGSAGLNNAVSLPSPQLLIPTQTRCYLVDTASAFAADDLPFSIATTFVGVAPPSGTGVIDPVYGGSGGSPSNAWLNNTSNEFAADTVWMPNLPVHGLNLRSAGGYVMPAGYPLNGYASCTVYFPGTYKSELVINGPTFFASGVYYFEKQVKLVGGADVVAGEGSIQGCSDNQYAAFYATNAPATHNITGLGATFVFGDEGRLVVDSTAGPVTFRMNQRYVSDNDTGGAPSAKVSIMTVNGDLDDALETTNFPASGIPLNVNNSAGEPVLNVPLSQVDSINSRPGPEDQYRPSVLTPEPREPTAPLNVQATAYNGAAVVTWIPPMSDGGSTVTGYTVNSVPASTPCHTDGQLSCAVTGLTNNTNYTFTVVATNVLGTSVPSTASANVQPSTARPTLTVPAAPPSVTIANDTVVPVPTVSRYPDAFTVNWGAQPAGNTAPVIQYDVVVKDLTTLEERNCHTLGELTCTVSGFTPPNPAALPLPYLPTFSVTVTARNAIGQSVASVIPLVTLGLPPAPGYVAPTDPPHAPYSPPAVVDISSATANQVTVSIPGYISVPQGVVRVAVDAGGVAGKMAVDLDGGVLAAWVELTSTRPSTFSLGLANPKTQRVIRIVTETTDGTNVRSDAVVQVNETGGWAVNSWVVQ
jgi:hypothetical protein